jgi:hypothetical protein
MRRAFAVALLLIPAAPARAELVYGLFSAVQSEPLFPGPFNIVLQLPDSAAHGFPTQDVMGGLSTGTGDGFQFASASVGSSSGSRLDSGFVDAFDPTFGQPNLMTISFGPNGSGLELFLNGHRNPDWVAGGVFLLGAAVPEPGPLALAGAGLALLGVVRVSRGTHRPRANHTITM